MSSGFVPFPKMRMSKARATMSLKKMIGPSITPGPTAKTTSLSGRKLPDIRASNVRAAKQKRFSIPSSNEQTVIVRMLSNWGDPDYISCSEIALLDLQHSRLSITSATTHSKKFDVDLYKLYGGTIMADSIFDFWKVEYDPEYPVEIELKTDSPMPIENIRFFNSKNQGTSAVKTIEILLNGALCWKGDVSSDFGIIAKLDVNKYVDCPVVLNVPPYVARRLKLYKDPFGSVPQNIGKKIEISFLSNYGNENTTGICNITLYDATGDIIPRKDVKVTLCGSLVTTTIDNVIMDKIDYIQNEENQILFKNSQITPKITICVSKPHVIGVLIIRICCVPELPVDLCARVTKIIIDGRVNWVGKLPCGTGCKSDQEKAYKKIYISEPNHRFKKIKGDEQK